MNMEIECPYCGYVVSEEVFNEYSENNKCLNCSESLDIEGNE